MCFRLKPYYPPGRTSIITGTQHSVTSRNHRRRFSLAATASLALALAACSGNSSSNGNRADHANTAELFSIPADQLSHIQIVTIQPTSLTRTLRLTGAVAYDAFHTTPVITQVSGPVSRAASS